MAFSQAVSGLNAAATNLDVIGNNIANSATYGFKSGTASFADMFAGSKVGLGVKVAGITQDFTDGTTTNTGRGLDVAISQNAADYSARGESDQYFDSEYPDCSENYHHGVDADQPEFQ